MGNTINFEANIEAECVWYIIFIKNVASTKIFENRNTELENLVKTYIEFYYKHLKNDPDKSNVLMSNQLKLIWTVHKTYPLSYGENIHFETLINQCLKQYLFCIRMSSLLEMYDFKKWCKKYKKFLKLCYKHPNKIIVPSLIENFIWYAHMQDHAKYKLDCQKIFNKVLNCTENISDEKLERYRRETKLLKDKSKNNIIPSYAAISYDSESNYIEND